MNMEFWAVWAIRAVRENFFNFAKVCKYPIFFRIVFSYFHGQKKSFCTLYIASELKGGLTKSDKNVTFG
jgi:hypothetical protein